MTYTTLSRNLSFSRFLATVLFFLTCGAGSALADWPQFMGPGGSGIAAADEKIAKSFPPEGPKELWHIALADGYSTPAVVGDKVYILDRPGEGTKEKFLVLDLATGHEDWSVEYESQPYKKIFGVTRSTPAVDGTMAYTVGITGDVTAYDLPGKKIAWQKNLKNDFGARADGFGFAASPLVLGDRLILDTKGSPKSGIVALDKKTGAQLWASEPFGSKLDTHATPVVATIDNVQQIIVMHFGTVVGIAATDGKLLWKYEWDNMAQQCSSPLYVGNGRIFLMTSHKVGCAMLDVTHAADQWQVKEVFKDKRSGALLANAVFYKGFIYTNASDKYKLQCLDTDGNVKWEGKSPGNVTIIIVDGTIMMLQGRTGVISLVEASPEGYKELASTKVFEPGKADTKELLAPLVVASGKLLVRDLVTLKCLDVAAK